ncbi:MAG: hypothetical protein WBO23_18695 [Burkholderiales bacterium]
MGDAQGEAAPQRRLITTRSEYLEGFSTLLRIARRDLRIFDPDLSQLDINSARRIELLTRFLRESLARRVLVALHDAEHVTRRCPRLLSQLGSYSGRIAINLTEGDAAKVQDCFVLADGEHLIRRPVTAQPRGVLVTDDPKECQPMLERFGEIWESSSPGVSANTTGL